VPTSTPVPPTNTPVPTSTPRPISTPPAPAATPTTLGIAPLTEYVDPEAELSVGYPADWRRLTEDEIRAQLSVADDQAVEAALANTQFVVVSPDGLATISYTRLPRPEGASLDDVASVVAEANAASVSGIGAIATEPLLLDGTEAVRLSFSADDPATGAADARMVRQWVATRDDWAIVLTAVVQADAASAFEETLQQVEESWRWRSQP
jgi:hypothetical protein